MISHTELLSLVRYEKETGHFIRLTNRRRWKAGTRIGASKGESQYRGRYVYILICGKRYYAHRLAWFYVHGRWPDEHIDHIDGDRSNSAIANLREATRSENMQNQKGPRKDNKSGLLGVSYDKGRALWKAQISKPGHGKSLIGRFPSKEEAYSAYLGAKARIHPFGTISNGVST